MQPETMMNTSASTRMILFLLFGLFTGGLFSCAKESSLVQPDVKSGSLARFVVHQGYLYSLNHHEVITFAVQADGVPGRMWRRHGLAAECAATTHTVRPECE